MAGINLERLGSVVDLFYEASVLPNVWEEALAALADGCSAVGATLSQFGGTAVALPSCPKLSAFASAYVTEHWAQRDVLAHRSIDRKLVNGFYSSTEIFSDREWQDDALAQRLGRSHGLGHYAFAHFWGLLGDTVTLRVYRPTVRPPSRSPNASR